MARVALFRMSRPSPMIVASLFFSALNGLLVHEQGENAPRKAGNRIDAGRLFVQPRQASLNHFTSPLVLERQERDRRRLDMGAQRHSVHDAVSRVPTSVDARTIQKHIDAQTDSFLRRLGAIAGGELLDGDDAEGCGDDPACGARNPGPTVLVGIELNVAISGFEFPSPEPMALSALGFSEARIHLVLGLLTDR